MISFTSETYEINKIEADCELKFDTPNKEIKR